MIKKPVYQQEILSLIDWEKNILVQLLGAAEPGYLTNGHWINIDLSRAIYKVVQEC